MQRLWLFIIAITLHNFPEGMAVGVGFAGGDMGKAMPLAIGIGLQNIPEDLRSRPRCWPSTIRSHKRSSWRR